MIYADMANVVRELKRGGYWLGRAAQIGLAGIAFILVVGAIAGNMNVLGFLVIAVFAGVLGIGVLVVEFLVVRPCVPTADGDG